jgi:TRAP-type C4-dicarboxylate transport system substrate-binding protein
MLTFQSGGVSLSGFNVKSFLMGLSLFWCSVSFTQAASHELRVHHPLPVGSTIHQQVLLPWCARIEELSSGDLKCRIFPSMQLGGTVPQLIDQVEDGVVDIIWTLPGYSPGRFPRSEVFELPFMIRDAEGASIALWHYINDHAMEEFSGMKLLALHVHGGGVLHMTDTPIRTQKDLSRKKVRAPTRQTTKFLAMLGATPVGMPVPQVPEALAKKVIEGTLLPYEVMPALKVNELTSYHSEPSVGEPKIYTSTFVLAMSKQAYAKLSMKLQAIIDSESGEGLSGRIGKIFGDAEDKNRATLPADSINVISKLELDKWKKISLPIRKNWIRQIDKLGGDGNALFTSASELIKRYEMR